MGKKSKACLFKAWGCHIFDEQQLHGPWASEDGRVRGEFPKADLIIYHLRMIEPADRRKRYERYAALDSGRRWQKEGYEYLLDDKGLRLKNLPRRRAYQRRLRAGHRHAETRQLIFPDIPLRVFLVQ